MEVKACRGNDIVRDIMEKEKITQVKLAGEMGELQGTVSTIINSPRMSLDKFVKMLKAMKRKVCVVNENGEIEYEVTK